MLFLDTNVVVEMMNRTSPAIAERFEKVTAREDVYLSSIVLFELMFGVRNSARPEENLNKLNVLLVDLPVKVLPFEPADANEAADIRAGLKRKGTPIGPYDVLIAAQARQRGATLVTANTREFSRVPGLKLEDWTQA